MSSNTTTTNTTTSSSSSSGVVAIKSVADYTALLTSLSASPSPSSSSRLLVLVFYAEWHAASVSLANETLNALSVDYPLFRFAKCEAEQEEIEQIVGTHQVQDVPTTVFVKRDGSAVDKVEGADPAVISTKVKSLYTHLLQQQQLVQAPPPTDQEVLTGRLRSLTNAGPLMLFIKGTPSAPRCGFTKQLLQLLDSIPLKYDYFDILSDNVVRENLKLYSNWPTYPQVYVNGELVGGLDVVKELHASGELLTMLPDSLKLKSASSSSASTSISTSTTSSSSLEDRLRSLLKREKVMLFMKGTRDMPQCGFSKKAVAMLNECEAKYDTFNILEDNEVREGLKALSNWPTYPQLYVDGELVGGVDVMTELHASGDLKHQLASN